MAAVASGKTNLEKSVHAKYIYTRRRRRQVCSALGADMYDCVYPTRTARFGTALVPEGVLKLKLTSMAQDNRPIDPDCDCMVCQKCAVTRSPPSNRGN
jgi:hypothetical protein